MTEDDSGSIKKKKGGYKFRSNKTSSKEKEHREVHICNEQQDLEEGLAPHSPRSQPVSRGERTPEDKSRTTPAKIGLASEPFGDHRESMGGTNF